MHRSYCGKLCGIRRTPGRDAPGRGPRGGRPDAILQAAPGHGTQQSWIPVVGPGGSGARSQPITNDMPRGRAGRDSIESAVRQALAGLRGHWRARNAPVDGLVREIRLTSAQLQLSNPPLTDEAYRPGGDEEARRTTAHRGRTLLLWHQFETALQTTRNRRTALRAEIEDVRRNRQALLRRRPPALGGTHPGLTDPSLAATAAVIGGVCTGCGSRLSDPLLVAVREGSVAACGRCRRLLIAATVA